MLDIKQQISLDIARMSLDGRNTATDILALRRVESALLQVDGRSIDRPGWFSSFLAEYVAKFYGVTILIIRADGFFSFVQVCTHGTSHTIVQYHVCSLFYDFLFSLGQWSIRYYDSQGVCPKLRPIYF